MSDCAIVEIYSALADLKIGKVKARGLSKVQLSVTKADLPMRMLLPSTEGEVNFISLGVLNRAMWEIRDLCLWAIIQPGNSLSTYAESMVQYLKLYTAAIKDLRGPTSQSNIKAMRFTIGPVPWGDQDLWAIDIRLTVEEIF
jgi:hypothetical protein